LSLDDTTLKRAFRNGWLLLLAAMAFVVLVFVFTLESNTPAPAPAWDMGGEPFVPASSHTADGYFVPPAAGQEGGQR